MPADATLLLVPPLSAYGGVPSMSLYWENLREALDGLGRGDLRIRAITPSAPWRVTGIRRRIGQRVVLPALIRRAMAEEHAHGRIPIVHVLDPHYAHLLPTRNKGMVTCHDLNALISPQGGVGKWEERWRLTKIIRAGAIHAISQHTAKDVERFFPAKASRIFVNYYGLAPAFRRRPGAGAAPHLEKIRAESDAIFILHVGSNIERKDIPTLLQGFALAKSQLRGERLRLVKVGDDLNADGFGPLLASLGIANDLIYLGSLGVEALVDVYNECTIFAFPSRYEGFGRPVAEAQACGLPCVLADASSLPEVGGSAALYHRAGDSAALARRIIDLVENPALRRSLVAAGIENAGRFTWRRHADILAESLQQLIDARRANTSG